MKTAGNNSKSKTSSAMPQSPSQKSAVEAPATLAKDSY